jgi:hypothetical protein
LLQYIYQYEAFTQKGTFQSRYYLCYLK